MPGVDWIESAQDKVQWRTLVNTGSGSIKGWEVTSRATVSFTRKNLLLGISCIEKCFRDIRVAEKVVFRFLPGCSFFILCAVTLPTNGRLLTFVRSKHSELYGLLDIRAAHLEQLPGKGPVGSDVLPPSSLWDVPGSYKSYY
jgi:hypothetical protein